MSQEGFEVKQRTAPAFYSSISHHNKQKYAGDHPLTMIPGIFLVDDNGLEPLTLRTSSGCSTS
jgi:hypothetical protein